MYIDVNPDEHVIIFTSQEIHDLLVLLEDKDPYIGCLKETLEALKGIKEEIDSSKGEK